MKEQQSLQQSDSQAGFTLVELIIVIVIIAILALIVLVGYTGITYRAHTATLQSDLNQAATTLGMAQAVNGSYPADQTSAGLSSSPGDTLTYNADGTGGVYCLQASGWNQTYVISNVYGSPQLGYCTGTVATLGSSGGGSGGGYVNGGVVSTYAGSGSSGATNGSLLLATFHNPEGIVVDSSGTIYVADRSNNSIRKISGGTVSTFAGGTNGSANGTGTAAAFNYPQAVGEDSSGNVYVADTNNNEIRMITPAGVVTTLAGSLTGGSANGVGSSASFNVPGGIEVDSSGNIYVADEGNSMIREVTQAGMTTTVAGTVSTGSANGTGTAASFNRPNGVTVDNAGNLIVADSNNNLIRKITSGGVVTTIAGSGTAGSANGTGTAASFNDPVDVAVDPWGNIFVADEGNNMIREITSGGVVSTLAGVTTAGSANGTGTAASFNEPASVAVDSNGYVYVADMKNNLIRIIK